MNSASIRGRILPFLTLPAVALLLASCEQQSNEYVEPPPPPVTVARPVQRDVTDYLEFTGVTKAVQQVEIRARVAGFLQSMHYKPSTDVQAGDLLFVIDPREYQAELDAANAELESAKAQLQRAEIELERAERLFKQKAGSEATVVQWRGERDVARAGIARAQATVERAQLNLDYTQVTAPIAGRVDRNLVDVGNLVGEGEPTLLTTVTQRRPMYVYFNLNERDLLQIFEMSRDKIVEKLEQAGGQEQTEVEVAEIPLGLRLANEQGFPHEGVVDYGGSGLDSGTGTIQLRGVFENAEVPPVLLSGLFTRVRMPVGRSKGALLVSERAIGADQGGRYVLVVNDEDTVEKHPVRLGALVDGLQVIVEGIQPDDRVIVKGLQRARPGAKVDPEETEMAALVASAKPAADEQSAEAAGSEETQAGEPAADQPDGQPEQAESADKS